MKRARQKQNLPNVALLIETTRSYGRNVLRGVADYARSHGPWVFYLPLEAPLKGVPPKSQWDGHGIIAQPHQIPSVVRELANCGLPVVSLSGPPGAGGLPSVRSNNEAVADMALRHFRDRGFKHFAYCGVPSEKLWPPTGELFRQAVERMGFKCEVYYRAYDSAARIMQLNELAAWIRSLPTPIGLLAANDLRAREVLDACRQAGVNVPGQIAVLGINDDELICELAEPPLSSVTHNARRIGFEAAAMLDRLMGGGKPAGDIIIDPLGVRARQSTDLLAIEDHDVAVAVRFIREKACEGIHVEDILDKVALSRRALEKRFRQIVGRPLHEEIRRVQMDRVKELLVTTNDKLDRIAEMTGFSSAQYLAGLFHRATSMTPGAWRAAGRSGKDAPG